MNGFERILDSGLQGRAEVVIMNDIIGRSATSFEAWGIGARHEMETLREDASKAEKQGRIVVRKDIEQNVE